MLLHSLLSELPPHLAERIHALWPHDQAAARPAISDQARLSPAVESKLRQGEFVLYWMRTAVRAHENPALDTALALSALLQRPLFVYHGLSEWVPYASDRHHHFILQGARDVAVELGGRNIGYAFHLQRRGHRGPHLRTLAERACIVITEDMPWAPLTKWTAGLAQALDQPVLTVDTACVLPARRIGRAWLRASAFRAATTPERLERAEQPWREITPAYPAYVPRLPFVPIDLSSADLPALIAECDIDHSIAAVPHTQGGSRAGYARWQEFLPTGLLHYAEQRDNPLLPQGTSRLSPYLHYGHVSPLRVARQAMTACPDGESKHKFLDELLTWRELAHVFCTYEPGHETLAAVPGWAKKTLAAHEADRRSLLPSWERLARGETGQPLWDAAQRSLLIHGELHNNLRMTWGKAVLGWTPDAATALALLIDLNHRYALDGRDPSSYGGILWCFGQFDRPFPPQRPYLGLVRPRSLREHGKKLALVDYQAKVMQPAHARPLRVAVLGDGLAALFCARTLSDHRFAVQVLAMPGAGQSEQTQMQVFCISDQRLSRYIESWMQEGVISCSTAARVKTAERAYVAAGATGTLVAHLARGLLRGGLTSQATLLRRADAWWLQGTQAADLFSSVDALGPFDAVVATDCESAAWLQRAVTEQGADAASDPGTQAVSYDARLGIGACDATAATAPSSDRVQHSLLSGMALSGRVLGAAA